MERGEIWFDLSFADAACSVPIVTTLVFLGEVTVVDGKELAEFLEVFEVPSEDSQFNVRMLDADQTCRLLNSEQLGLSLGALIKVVPERWLDKLGF